ncbi:MAG: phosphatidylglycerol lysyltransferase domain-containing protein [Acidobacteriota bacterium]
MKAGRGLPDLSGRGTRRLLVRIAGLVTLGSGVVNIVSAAGKSLPARVAVLKDVFPLEFLHVARFLSLLIGISLAVSSLNIFKRKKRAYILVMVLSALSIIFHLTKGLDYEEAIGSLALMAILFLARRNFTVKSVVPDVRSTAARLGTALAATLLYGTAGFWLLDKRDFGVDFNVADGIRQTLAALVFNKDPSLVPRTRFAAWFLDSLDLIAVAAVLYALYSLFRPVYYRLRTLPQERSRAAGILEAHGKSSLDPFKLAADKSYFFSASGRSFLAYRMAGTFAVVLADPAGPDDEIGEIIRAFRDLCGENDWRLAFYQVLPDFLPLYRAAGFKKMKVGDDAIVELAEFNLEGKRMKHIRHAVNQLDKTGISAVRYDPPVADGVLAGIREVSDDWLGIPGRRERGFTVGVFSEEDIRRTPVFAAVQPDGRILAFMNIIRSYAPGETTIDLMRHRRDAPAGVMDFLFVRLFEAQKARGFTRFSLGLAPMSGFREGEDAGAEERAVQYFLQRSNFLFSYSGLLEYKAKFATRWEPRYAIYRNVLELPRFAVALIGVSGLKDEGAGGD